MDKEWLSDGELEREEEMHRLDCENALSYPADMPYEESEEFFAGPSPPDEGYPAEAPMLPQPVTPLDVEGATSMSSTMIPNLGERRTASENMRQDGEQARMADILLPERTALTPNENVKAVVTLKRDLCRMRSATIDPAVYSRAHRVKRRRIRDKSFQPLFHASTPKEMLVTTDTEPVEPKSKAEKNRMWNYIRTFLRAPFKDSEQYQKLDWHSGQTHWNVMRKGLSDYWLQLSIEDQIQMVARMRATCQCKEMCAYLCHLQDKLQGRTETALETFKRFRATMCLCTWITKKWQVPLPKNCTTEDIGSVCTNPAVRVAAENLGKRFRAHMESVLCKAIRYQHFAIGVEVCCKTLRRTGIPQLHLHLFWHGAPDRQLKAETLVRTLTFDNELPQFTTCRMFQRNTGSNQGPRQRACEKVIKKSMFYILGPKLGKVWHASDQDLDWSNVNPQWVTELVSSEKIAVEEAHSCYLKIVHNARHHVEQLEYVAQKRSEIAVARESKQRLQALFDSLGEIKELPQVLKWQSMLVDGAPRHKFLVLCGPSGMGKSLFALKLAGSVEAFYECDCSNNAHPNLRNLDRGKTSIALFDECRVSTVLAHKRLFQGHQFPATLGVSPTNRDSYKVCLHGVGIIIASNTWEDELKEAKQVDAMWINENSVLVNVTEPLYKP